MSDKPYQSLLTREEVAEWLNVSVSTVRKLERDGQLPRVKIGDGVRYRHSSIQAYIEGRETFINQRNDLSREN